MSEERRNNGNERSDAKRIVLIIDDDPNILLLLETALQTEHYELISCDNGPEGLVAAERYNPAVIVCDWMMPGMDGLEVCRRVKANQELNLSYFILLTAWGNTDNRVVAFDTGADDFIQKPPNIKELKARVRAGVRIHELNWALHLRQKEMEFDLSRARDYIQSILPNPLHADSPEGSRIILDWVFIPSAHLGGDVFNYQWIDESTLAIYLLDVAGHGVGAALLSVSIQNMLRTSSIAADLNSPSQVIGALNRSFPMDRQNNLFFTMWYGVVNFDRNVLVYACAGHPPALIQFEDGSVELLKSKGIPVGMASNFEYEQRETELKRSSLLTLFSDGIYETPVRGENGELSRWLDIVKRQPSRTVPVNIKENLDYLIGEAREMNGSARFDDDVSLIQMSIEIMGE